MHTSHATDPPHHTNIWALKISNVLLKRYRSLVPERNRKKRAKKKEQTVLVLDPPLRGGYCLIIFPFSDDDPEAPGLHVGANCHPQSPPAPEEGRKEGRKGRRHSWTTVCPCTVFLSFTLLFQALGKSQAPVFHALHLLAGDSNKYAPISQECRNEN